MNSHTPDSKAVMTEAPSQLGWISRLWDAPHAKFLFVIGLALIVLTGFLVYAGWPDGKVFGNTVSTDKPSALESLKFTKDWGVWMASIQTATLAALGILAKDGAVTLKPGKWQTRLILMTAIFNTLALFFSAWLLTSTSSIALRLAAPHSEYGFDYYNFSLWNFSADWAFLGKAFSVGFVALCNHWFWALGIICFGLLTVSLAISRSRPQATPAPPATFEIKLSRDAEGSLKATAESAS